MTRMSASEYRTQAAKPKRSKYGAEPTVVDGIRFDSKKEARRYQELKQLEKQGEISHLERQPKFKFYIGDRPVLIRSERYPNGRHAGVKFDFAYFDGKHRIIEDVKGGQSTRTEAYTLRKALVEAMYPAVRVVEV
jgi:hypothetical protein